MSIQLIGSVTVGAGGANSVAFNAIPQDGTDLLLLWSSRSNVSATNDLLGLLQLNSAYDSSAVRMSGDGSNVTTSASIYPLINRFSATANTFSNNCILIPSYTSSANKTVSVESVTENNGNEAYAWLQTGRYVTGAVTSLNIGGVIAQNSTASLYKITKA